jgi:SAM-dependent methyltransferase
VATDPLHSMLVKLSARIPVQPVVSGAEQIPLPSRSADVVVCGQSFHWFDHARAMPEIARVLRPGGSLAVAWNTYDTDIPWVRRLAALLAPPDADDHAGDIEDPRVFPFVETPYFGFVEQKQFRFWQPHTAASLADLTSSVSHVATMDERGHSDIIRHRRT